MILNADHILDILSTRLGELLESSEFVIHDHKEITPLLLCLWGYFRYFKPLTVPGY